MTYSKGSSITAADYNNLVGSTNVNAPYSSSAAATQKVAALLGVGFGDRGYGQTSPVLTGKTAGENIKAQDFVDLRTAIANLASFQGTAVALLPPATQYVAGASMIAGVPATTAYDIPTMIANVDTNRLNTNSGASLSVTSGVLTVNRFSAWGSALGGIVSEVTATFASEDAARFFFNTGGALNLVLSHPSVATPQDVNWNTILSALGTISIAARTTTRSGGLGTPSALGYYNLTGAYQTVFNGTNIGSGAYSANDVLVEALVLGVGGVNGGNGTQVKIRITLTDQHTNTFYDIVQTGTNASFGYKKAAVVVSGIASPALATVTSF
jgi:hypothetical protein